MRFQIQTPKLIKLRFILIFFYNKTTMQKQQPINNQNQQEFQQTEIQLNQHGRPKQIVILYELTQQMKHQAIQKINLDKNYLGEQAYEKAQNETKKVWDKFYNNHKLNFFKDRTYLQRELPQITDFKQLYEKEGIISNYIELGCGVGNTLFPLLKNFQCFKYYGCDISSKAIKLIQKQIDQNEQLKKKLEVDVCDLAKDQIPFAKTGDIVSLIFVLSAIVPQKHFEVICKIVQWMKPGSFLYFRDYGRYDFGQINLSSKGNKKLKDNFYMKNDGVCVYYFEKEEIQQMCIKAGLVKIKVEPHCKLLQNRKRNLKMYRVWIQGRFYKPPLDKYFEQKRLIREKIDEQKKIQKQTKQAEKEETKKQNITQKIQEKIQQKQE